MPRKNTALRAKPARRAAAAEFAARAQVLGEITRACAAEHARMTRCGPK